MKKKHKYHATQIKSQNKIFASKKEFKRYQELKILEKCNIIKDLKVQPKYVLQDEFFHKGKKIRQITYIADFEYIDCQNNEAIIEDTKGYETPVFKLKKKLFLKRYPNMNLQII